MLRRHPGHGPAACDPPVSKPVLVIVGTEDPATPPETGELVHQSIRGSRLVKLEAAHLSNIEQPAAFTRALLAFFGEPASS